MFVVFYSHNFYPSKEVHVFDGRNIQKLEVQVLQLSLIKARVKYFASEWLALSLLFNVCIFTPARALLIFLLHFLP
jgi:hypothetical protein